MGNARGNQFQAFVRHSIAPPNVQVTQEGTALKQGNQSLVCDAETPTDLQLCEVLAAPGYTLEATLRNLQMQVTQSWLQCYTKLRFYIL